MAPAGTKNLPQAMPGQVITPTLVGFDQEQKFQAQKALFTMRAAYVALHGRMLSILFTSVDRADQFLQEYAIRYLIDGKEEGKFYPLQDALFDRSNRMLMFWLPYEPDDYPNHRIQLGIPDTSIAIHLSPQN